MDQNEMKRVVRAGWNAVADEYHERLGDELSYKPFDRDWLQRFRDLSSLGRPVLDVGCGPGHVSAYLSSLGLDVEGCDLSDEMIRVARAKQPGLTFFQADMLELELEAGRYGGALCMYSLIHLIRENVPGVLRRVRAGLVHAAPLLIAVHRGSGDVRADQVFDRPVQMAATLFVEDELAAYAEQAGFEVLSVEARPPYPEEFSSERVYLMGCRR